MSNDVSPGQNRMQQAAGGVVGAIGKASTDVGCPATVRDEQ
jgi:hypothetical protein